MNGTLRQNSLLQCTVSIFRHSFELHGGTVLQAKTTLTCKLDVPRRLTAVSSCHFHRQPVWSRQHAEKLLPRVSANVHAMMHQS